MKFTTRCFLFILISLSLTAEISASRSQAEAFEGEWKNVSNTGGITRIVISRAGREWSIKTWGKCHPIDCESEKVVLKSVGTSVADGRMDRGFAVWDHGYSDTYMVLKLEARRLVTETITIFKDRSSRANYRVTETFQRADEQGSGDPAASEQPRQLSPPDGSKFSIFPRTTTLTWTRVPGAISYGVEIDCFHCCEGYRWCSDVGGKYEIIEALDETTYTFNYVGAQAGRWRVWANFPKGRKGAKSGWWIFQYLK